MSRLSIFRDEQLILEQELLGRQIALGRHPDNDIVLEDRTLSRFHARLESRGMDDYAVIALPNQNGVFVNGTRVVGERDLEPGDRIRLGCYVAIYDPPRAEAAGRGRRESTRSDDLRSDITANFTDDIPLSDADMDVDFEESSEGFTGPTGEIDDPFSAPATSVEHAQVPRFVLTYNGVEVSRHDIAGEVTIGRSKLCDVVISLLGLSRKHAVVTIVDGVTSVRDMGSQNGTWVNNNRIDGEQSLVHGDILNFYEYSLIYVEDEQAELDLVDSGFDLGMPTGAELGEMEARPTHARDLKNGRLVPPTKRTKVAEPGSLKSQLDELGLGDGSYLGDEFDDAAIADAPLEGTDLVEADLDFGDLDDDDEFDHTTFSGRPPEVLRAAQADKGWARDEELLSALAAGQREALVSLEVYLDGTLYTQLAISKEVTRIGSDARCELALPPESGVAPWHCTLLHVGAGVVCYRASRTAHLDRAGDQFDSAVLENGDAIQLGRVRIVVMQR